MSELERLRLSDIPEGRQLLREQHGNLLRVAEYCQGNYLQASDKRKALEETMALSTQSLASVTYQVSSLASAFLRLLDLQAAQLRQVEADITCVAQRVDIHKEKVSRREIGALTVTKRVPSGQRVVAPPEPPVLEPYYRKPLNFSVLDGIGHGVKTYLEKVVALYPYTAQKDSELSLEPGALLFVTRRLSGGWCEGTAEQNSGIFPGNYVEPV
ncbi:hypothetical protein Nmel_018450 [Mimus melanotis]